MAMKKTKLILSAGVAAGALLGLALTMPEIPKLNLGGEKRIAAYLSTDKMIYCLLYTSPSPRDRG